MRDGAQAARARASGTPAHAGTVAGRRSLLLRVFVSAVLLGIVLVYVDVNDLAAAIRDGEWGWFAAALGLMALAMLPGAARWRLILQKAEIELSRTRAGKTFAASLFLNNVLPTSIGGDAARAWSVGRESGRLLRSALATIVDRTTAVVCLFILAWTALAVDSERVPNVLVRVLLWLTVGLVAASVFAVLAAALMPPVLARAPRRVMAMVDEARRTLSAWARSARLIGWLLVLGLLYQLLAVVALLFVGEAVGVDLSFALAAITAAIVVVAMLVPISVGGLGIREGGFVLLLGEAGIDGAEATLISLLSSAAVLVSSAAVVGLLAAYETSVRRGRTRSLPREPSA
jgi:glycosyltransferase 2 family protein